MRRKMSTATTNCTAPTYSTSTRCSGSLVPGSRYAISSAPITRRRWPCWCWVAGCAARGARRPASRPGAALAGLRSAITPFVLDLEHFLARAEEGFDHARVEVPPGLRAQVLERL